MKIEKTVILDLINKLALNYENDIYLAGKIDAEALINAINKLKPPRDENNKIALMWIKGTWNVLYEKYTIEPPVVCYGKDVRHIATLIANGLTMDQLDKLAEKYFEIWKHGDDRFISHNEPMVGIFFSQINKLDRINSTITKPPMREL